VIVRYLVIGLAAAVALAATLAAQGQAQAQGSEQEHLPARLSGEFTPLAKPDIANGPVPRMPDGHPDLSGPWVGGGSNQDIEKDGGLKPGELPLLAWAKQLRDSRKEEDEPYLYCTPMSVPRTNPYPWRFVQSVTAQGLSTFYVIHENGDAGGVRKIFMDGRTHPPADDLLPTWWGHSIGRWEGDTLVIDTVNFNGKTRLDTIGHPHSDQLHLTQRFSRPDLGHIAYEVIVDDPKTFTRSWKNTRTFTLRPDWDMMEYSCEENNKSLWEGRIKVPKYKQP